MHARSRRRDGRERERTQLDDEDDYGEGCSYTTALAASVASRSITRDHAPAHAGATTRELGLDSNSTLPCTCSSTRIYTLARRRARVSRASATLTATAMVVATAAHGVHASPVDPKGKRREDAQEGQEGSDYAPSVQMSHSAHAADALAAPDALLDSDQVLSFQQQQARSGLERRRNDGTQQQQEQRQLRRDTWRSNTPEGVPSYYELVDGEWVPTRDWALNGKAGGPPERESANTGASEENTYVAHDGSDQNSADHASTVSHHSSSATTTTIGWAKSTNVVFGVDINTSDREEESVTTSTTSSHIATRTGLPTITSTSSTATGASTAATRSSTPGQVYDFSRDVPNGWVSDGRTAAYAVPVIIGLSIFLACLIFSLIIVLLRMAKSRRRRMKAHQNGKLKLSEEGVVPRHSRPASPGGSSIAAGSDNGSDNSSILRRRRHNRAVNGDSDSIEEEKQHSRKRIGRKWAPGISGGLRKRRTKIAELFRRNEEKVVIIAEDGEMENTAPATEQEMQPLDNRTSANGGSSTELARSGSAVSATSDHSATSNRLSRQPSMNSITPSARGRPSISRTQSLRIDTSASSDAEPTEARSARSSRPRSRSSVDMNDHHAVPVPAVGPPAYMQPASPAYTRATPATFSEDGSRPSTANTALTNSLRAGGAVAAAGYLSAVSTPGLASSIDEKRGLLSGVADAGPAASGSSDAFREHRRYEHLYASREGEAARVEQVTGASSSSSSSRETQAELDARVREEEGSRRRELQQAMAGHVAVSDKEVLGRLRLAASAPDAHEANVAATPTQGMSTTGVLHASAPSLNDAEEDDIVENLQAESSQPAGAAYSTSSLLPRPPQAARASALDRLPRIDEKTRLRQLEDEQAARTFDMHEELPSAPPPSTFLDTASAPPSSAPSAPSFESDGATAAPPAAPSAPPYLPEIEVTEASARAEDDEPAVELPEQHTRRYEEGVI